MAVSYVPLPVLGTLPRWRFVRPILQRALPDDKLLLLHADSGSWAIIPQSQFKAFVELAVIVEKGAAVAATDQALLARLYEAGLVERDGRTVYSDFRFDHVNGPLRTLLLKLVGYCNLACTYCYDFDRRTYDHELPTEIAEQSIVEAIELADDELTVLFHGGEPLLVFEKLVHLTEFSRRVAAERGKTVRFSVQTNGTRFQRPVVDFLLQEDFGIGISLDGPEEVNDQFRVNHQGTGSHRTIREMLERFPELLPRVGILTTITRANVTCLLEVARYVRSLGVRAWDATMFDAGGRGADRPEEFAATAVELVEAHRQLFDAVEEGEFDGFAVRPVLRYLRNVMSYRRESFCLRNGCGAAADLAAVAADGTVKSCDCIQDRELDLGHMRDLGLAGALATDRAASIRGRHVETLAPCRSCEWRVYCGGTCLARASLDSVDPVTCHLSMELFPHIFRRLAVSDRLIQYAESFN